VTENRHRPPPARTAFKFQPECFTRFHTCTGTVTVITVLHSCYSESTLNPSEALRAIVHLLICPAFRVSQGHVLMHVLTIIMHLARLSLIALYTLYLHPHEACRPSLSPPPTVLLSSSQFLTFPPYVSYSPYSHIIQLQTNFR
jgi:hypothetical protein